MSGENNLLEDVQGMNDVTVLDEKLHTYEVAFDACKSRIDQINEQLERNEITFTHGEISKKEYRLVKKKLKKQQAEIWEEAKKNHKEAFMLRKELHNTNINIEALV